MKDQMLDEIGELIVEDIKLVVGYLKNVLSYEDLRIARKRGELIGQLEDVSQEDLQEAMDVFDLICVLSEENMEDIKEILRNIKKSDPALNAAIEISYLPKDKLIAQFALVPKSKMLQADDPFLEGFFSALKEEESGEKAHRSWHQGLIVLYMNFNFSTEQIKRVAEQLGIRPSAECVPTDGRSDLIRQFETIPKKDLVRAIDAVYPEIWLKVDGEYLEQDYGADRTWPLRDIIDYMFEWYDIVDIKDVRTLLNNEKHYDIKNDNGEKELMRQFAEVSKPHLIVAIDGAFEDFWNGKSKG